MKRNTFPNLSNATWPVLVGKGTEEGQEPPMSLERILDLTAAANVGGERFTHVDVICDSRHGLGLDATDADIERFANIVRSRDLYIATIVAPVWASAGGGSAMGDNSARAKFLDAIRFACRVARIFRRMGVREFGNIRVDSAEFGIAEWCKSPAANTARIVHTFKEATKIAMDHGERLAAEMEICWAGMHSIPEMVNVLEGVGEQKGFGLMADLAHIHTAMLGFNAPEDAVLSPDRSYTEEDFWAAYKDVANKLRPWTIDVHIAQNDGTVHGAGNHDKTGRHCTADDPKGKLDIVRCAGYWLQGATARGIQHICWDGCMFPNAVLENQGTWNTVLTKMIDVRDAHGWV